MATSTHATAAIVAPASGIKSSRATRRPSATANGTPASQSTMPDETPAIRLMKRLPVT